MASVLETTDGVRLRLSALERLGALHGDIDIPWHAVRSVRRTQRALSEVRGLRAPGTGLPGIITLGTWRAPGRRTFAAAYRGDSGYSIELDGHRYDRIVVSSPSIPALDARIDAVGPAGGLR